MSGGHWDYKNDDYNIYGFYASYGERGFNNAKLAKKKNPFEDREMSELIWDVFCVINSADYYFSGDTGEEQYKADIKYFKDKWLGKTQEERVRREIEDGIEDLRKDLYEEFKIEEFKIED